MKLQVLPEELLLDPLIHLGKPAVDVLVEVEMLVEEVPFVEALLVLVLHHPALVLLEPLWPAEVWAVEQAVDENSGWKLLSSLDHPPSSTREVIHGINSVAGTIFILVLNLRQRWYAASSGCQLFRTHQPP